MNAQTFKQIWLERMRKEMGEKEFIWFLMGDGWENKFAEDYLKSKVEAIRDELIEIRNVLYDNVPTGEVHAFDLIKVIKNHISKIDEFQEQLLKTI